MRIAIGSLFQESNEFVSLPTELDLFRNSYLYERDELFRLAGTNTEVAGLRSLRFCFRRLLRVPQRSNPIPFTGRRAHRRRIAFITRVHDRNFGG